MKHSALATVLFLGSILLAPAVFGQGQDMMSQLALPLHGSEEASLDRFEKVLRAKHATVETGAKLGGLLWGTWAGGQAVQVAIGGTQEKVLAYVTCRGEGATALCKDIAERYGK